MPEKYDAIASIFVDSEGGGRLYIPKDIVEKMKLESGQHFKVFVNGSKITFEKVE
jgi:bifunctional DNA-binding transcriptional regulator/antitoxin component of YhaV-PrlF toxin-antitoxin module